MDINSLRAEVERRQKAANAKISRLRRKGVQLAGSEFDVRRDPSRIGRYNTRQLESYLGQLNDFTHRRNQFVAGSEGTPIRAHVFNHAMRTATEYNSFVKARESSIADTQVPNTGMNIAELGQARGKSAKGGPGRPFTIEQREAFEFVNEARLKDWRNSLEAKMRPGYLEGKLSMQRDQMLKAVTNFGDKELLDQASRLTDEQLDTLWNYTNAPQDLFSGYHHQKLLAAGLADETDSNIHDDAAGDVRDWLSWAESLPPRGNRPNRR